MATAKAPAKKAAAKPRTSSVLPEILVNNTVLVPIRQLSRYPKNPRVGNIEAIKESISENGFFRPLLVQKSTNYVIGGNHSWAAAVELGLPKVPVVFLDVDDARAAKIVLADNRTNDLATYNSEILAELMKDLDSPIGTGYSQDDYDALVEAIEYHDVELLEDVIRPSLTIQAPTEEGGMAQAVIKNPVSAGPTEAERAEADLARDEEDGTLDQVDAKLQGLLQLSEEVQFKSSNYYGIPDLLGGGLLDKLPPMMDTWAGEEATPDDGKTTWVWNYGVASRKNLPGDRAILCFYTYDHFFEGWWDNPAFFTAKVINMGITRVIVPDFSFYDEFPTALHIYNTYRAQWLGRYFQEAGLKVIPRLQFALNDEGRSLDFCMAGIPKNPPILASSIQNAIDKESYKHSVDNLKKALQALQPAQWLVYGGNPALKQIEALDPVNKGLCGEVVHVYNYAHKRRGVVYDKQEGLQGVKKERKLRAKDKYAEQEEEPEPQTTASKRAAKKAPAAEVDDSSFDDE